MADNLISATVGSTNNSYSYDGDGNRLSATDGTTTTSYLRDENALAGLPQLARESDGSGNLIRRYLTDPHGPSTMQTTAGSFYYLRDPQQSIAVLTDGSANNEWSYTYEPFGPTRTATKIDPSAPDNNVQFDAQFLASEVGLYDLRARQYDSADGRFLSTDPLAPALTDPYGSSYAYTGNQPTVFHDPSGMSSCWIITRLCDAAKTVAEDVYGIGKALVVGTIDSAVSFARNSWDCITGVAAGEMRGASRQCLKAAAVLALVVATDGAATLLEQVGARSGLKALLQRLWREEGGALFGAEAGADSIAALRAAELQAQLPVAARGRVTMGVGVLEDANGKRFTVVATSEPRGYLRPGVKVQLGEHVVSGNGHAEENIVAWAQENGYHVVSVGAGRPICPRCATTIAESGGSAATPLRGGP